MRLSKEKRLMKYSMDYIKTGRMNGYTVTISYSAYHDEYYFLLKKGNYSFNSLWQDLRYATEEGCVIGAEKYVDELAKIGGAVCRN